MTSILLLAALIQQKPFVHAKTEEYKRLQLQGFTVMVSPAALADAKASEKALAMLESKLAEVKRVVPTPACEQLVSVRIWVERDNPENRGAVYHPSAGWLEQNGYNKDKERGVEIGSIYNFVEWGTKTQPMMVLHELAHAYHHQVLGYEEQHVARAFEEAKASGRYESVAFVSGGEQRHYGLTNSKEYFAESSEAYFGMNDFYPFNRWQLLAFDRTMYEALVATWGLPKGQSMVIGTSATPEVLKGVGRHNGTP